MREVIAINRKYVSTVLAALFGFPLYLSIFFDSRFGYSDFSESSYLISHTILEFSAIFIAVSIALQGWLFFKGPSSAKIFIFSSAFLAVGIFDFMHILSFRDMPGYQVDFPYVSSWFWLSARLTETVLFVVLVSRMDKQPNTPDFRQILITLTILFTAGVSIIIFTLSPILPPLSQHRELTLWSYWIISIITIVHTVIFIHALISIRKGLHHDKEYIAPASMLLIFSTFTSLSQFVITDWSNFVSHIFKVVGYIYLFRLVFIRYGERPFKELEDMSATYKRLLNSVVEGIYGIDKEGKVTFINEPASRMLGYREDELLGRIGHPIIHHTKADGSDYPMEECPICHAAKSEEHTYAPNELFWDKRGESFPVEYFTRPIYEDGQAKGTIVTFLDLTDKKKLESLEVQHQHMKHEVALAASVQQSLLTALTNYPEGVDIGYLSIPFKELNGDFYTLYPKEREISIAIADVCGKGIPAAIQMTMMKYAMEQGNPPDHALTEINRFSNQHMDDMSFITMLASTYDIETRMFHYSSAGHEPALHYHHRDRKFSDLSTTGPILGVMPEMDYQSKRTQLDPGDFIIFYTDGMIERKENLDDNNKIIKECFLDLDLSNSAQEITQNLFDFINKRQPFPIEDDQTLILLKVENRETRV
ncbi:SpoIIE family protein phosphatase [Bacillus haimaensis]|uniref:SpoIIE family protein phosphatase n=1 Tax=Bacillus haimaensis TaxID=3160967 RepID=UPI003AA85762